MKSSILAPNLSLYLDVLRLLAALLVFLGHANSVFYGFNIRFIFGQAANAVAIFFVLSGFVISFVVSTKEVGWKQYTIARASRIYSVALLAIVVTFVADQIGLAASPQAYDALNDKLHFMHEDSALAALAYIGFANQIWFSHVVFGSNEPFWSLGFEVWYYVVFGLLYFLSSYARLTALILWVLVCGPKILMYLPLWLLGVLTHKIVSSEKIDIGRVPGIAIFLISIVMYYYVATFAPKIGHMYDTYNINSEIRNFAYYMGIGLAVSANIIGFNFATSGINLFPRILALPIRWLAGASFTLYLVHLPLLILFAAMVPISLFRHSIALFGCAAVLLLVLLLAEFGERRKTTFRLFFSRIPLLRS